MENDKKMLLFYGGPLSQWYGSKFKEGEIEYNTAEQYMMAKKALLFGDMVSYQKIMDFKNPRDQKAQGKKVFPFDKEKWNSVCRDIVREGNRLKFTQNPELYTYLMATHDAELVEASEKDDIWGIGLSETDPRALDRTQWRGTNWLGIAIMEVRDLLLRELE